MDAASWALATTVFVACVVESAEATTIVMAMGFTRSWRSALLGTGTALVTLVVFTWAAGYALANWLPETALQLVIGTLLLIFGLQWLRKAIYRSAGRKAKHDEDRIFQDEVQAAREAGANKPGLDLFAFMVSLKGVFLEGVEVVFIVLTFGLSAGNVPVAVGAAASAVLVVLVIAVIVHRPLSMIPENTLKFGVGLLLTAFGIYWSIEGLGILRTGHQSLQFPGADLAIMYFLLAAAGLSWMLIRVFRRTAPAASMTPSLTGQEGSTTR